MTFINRRAVTTTSRSSISPLTSFTSLGSLTSLPLTWILSGSPTLAAAEQDAGANAPAPTTTPALRTSAAPPAADVDPARDQTITVMASLNHARNQISASLGATSYDLSAAQIANQSQGADAPFSQVLLRLPGVAQDQYGQVHVRGEHANLQFRINGVLLPEGLITFGQEIDTHVVGDVSYDTGSLPAQYGLRTAGVVDITTRSGAFDPGGTVSVYGGSNQTGRAALSYGSTIGRWDAYASAGILHSELGIDNPTSSPTAIHDTTDQYRGFLYLSYLIDASSRLSLIASSAGDRFEIPDNPGQVSAYIVAGAAPPDSAQLDSRQDQNNSYEVLAYQKSVGDATVQVAPYLRQSHLVYRPDEDGELAFNGAASAIDRSALTLGAQLDATLPLDDAHTLRAGAAWSLTDAAIDCATAVFPVNPDGTQASTTPETITADSRLHGSFYSLYVQDEWHLTPQWTINDGLRFDAVTGYDQQLQVSPRLNTTYQLRPSTTVHAGYARYFTPPPLEAVSQETVATFAGTSNAAPTTANAPVSSERANYVDAGITQSLGSHAQVGLDGYYKRATDQLDEGQFGSAIILSPFNYREGRIMGAELTGTYQDAGWTAFANGAVSQALGTQINSAQFLFGADELAYTQSHRVYLDHDQRWTASAGVSYTLPCRLSLGLDSLYGSGLRDGFANTGELPSYATANLSLRQTWHALEARFDIVNICDRVYEIRDGSGIGVAAPSYGPRRGYFGGVSYRF